jgi:hypothetical protein
MLSVFRVTDARLAAQKFRNEFNPNSECYSERRLAALGLESEMTQLEWKKEDGSNAQAMPSWSVYVEAMNQFKKSATAFMEHVHFLSEAKDAYQKAMTASTALRSNLDAGDRTLGSLMSQLEQVIDDHLGEPHFDREKPELVGGETPSMPSQNTGTYFP